MKNLVVIFCFALIAVFTTGSYLIHSCYLKSYKKEFKSFIAQQTQHSLQSSILINPSELFTNSSLIAWEDENKEVIYRGVLYDVIQIKNKGMKVELIVVSDAQEMQLKKHFSEVYDLNSHESTKNPYHLLKSFFSLKCIVSQNQLTCDLALLNGNEPDFQNSFFISPVYLSLESPPPRFSV